MKLEIRGNEGVPGDLVGSDSGVGSVDGGYAWGDEDVVEEVLGVSGVSAAVISNVSIVIMGKGFENDVISVVRDDLEVSSIILRCEGILRLLIVFSTAIYVRRYDELSLGIGAQLKFEPCKHVGTLAALVCRIVLFVKIHGVYRQK